MKLPIAVASPSSDVSIAPFSIEVVDELFAAIDHEQVWAHIPGPQPQTPTELATAFSGDSAVRQVFVVSSRGEIKGTSSYYLDASDTHGVEIGATLYTPDAWGSGINAAVKGAMLSAAFEAGAAWVQFRTDERNGRSAAAILKLPGAVELPPLLEPEKVRKDGSVRTSRMFRVLAPERSPV